MRIRIDALAFPALGLLAACSTNTVRGTAPAPANALSCAQTSLESLGYSTGHASTRQNGFSARRNADRRYVYRIDHIVNVSAPENGTLELTGRRVEVREVASAVAPPQAATSEPEGTTRRLEVDESLRSEVAQVIQQCGGATSQNTGAVR